MRWIGELPRRKVLKVGAVYLATAWVRWQRTHIVAPALASGRPLIPDTRPAQSALAQH